MGQNQITASAVRMFRSQGGTWAAMANDQRLANADAGRLGGLAAEAPALSSHAIAKQYAAGKAPAVRAADPTTAAAISPPDSGAVNYDEYTKVELYNLAKSRDLDVIYRMTKAEILAVLTAADAGG